MTTAPAQTSADPIHAPLWRKLLALRVVLLCIVGLATSISLIDWLDTSKPDIPSWLRDVFIGLAVLPFVALIFSIKAGAADLAVHFIPEGRVRRLLLWGDRSPEVIAQEFGQSGYWLALFPFIVPLVLLVIVAVALVLIGGVAMVIGAVSSMFAGWPTWAIVISILLVGILLKK